MLMLFLDEKMGENTRGDALNQGKDTMEPNAVGRTHA